MITANPYNDLGHEPAVAHENDWYSFKSFDGYRVSEQPLFSRRQIRVIVVGAGACGLQFAYKAEKLLKNVDLQIYEKNHDVGGTWLENRYPGCTCDIPSHSYQFTWAPNPNWSSFYASSEEIWRYMKDVALKYDLEKYIKFNTKVKSATWDEDEGLWKLELVAPDGSRFLDYCTILINASGVLNESKLPQIEGIDKFQGKIMHSAAWDNSYDLQGKRVAVIGGGSSAVQIVPSIQPSVKKLYAFLRSPVWVTTGFAAKYAGPGGTNFKYTPEQIKKFHDDTEEYEKYRRDVEGELNRRFTLMHLKSTDQQISRETVSKMMAEKLGNTPELIDHLTPSWALGCRRLTPGNGYLESLGSENVQVVPRGAMRFAEHSIIDTSGEVYDVDAIICATGFDTSFAPHFKVHGRDSEIHEQFGDFPIGYLSIAARNYPNLFLITGPNGPASHGSALPILDWCTRYVFQMIDKIQQENIKSVEPKPDAIKDLYNHTHEIMKRLVWSSACRSWFKNGKEHGPVTAIFPGSRLHFFEVMKTPRFEDYEIKYRTDNRFQYMGNGYTELESDPNGDAVWYFDDPFVKA